jgi:hypothetical protein
MFTGISISSPYVARTVALYKERNSDASYAEVRDAIVGMASIDSEPCDGNRVVYLMELQMAYMNPYYNWRSSP